MSAPSPAGELIAASAPENPLEIAPSASKFGTPESRAAGRAILSAQRAAWPPVRQPHPDDIAYLKALLKARGLRNIPELEPATERRLAQLLRRAGLTIGEAREAVGLPLAEYIARNPGMALWWILAVALEAAA